MECNSESEKLIRRTRDEIIGMNQSELFPGDQEQKIKERLVHIQKGSVTDFEAVVQHKDGSTIPVLISEQIFPFHDRDLVMGFYTDASPLKKHKEKIKKFYEHIDHTKSEFISLASHQMRAPLSTINWYSEMLLSGDAGKLKDKQKKYFKVVYENSQKMIKLINGLLNVSRVELSTLAILPVPTDITKSADTVLAQFKPQMDEKKQKFSKTYQSELPMVSVDPDVLKLILKNLLSNAAIYTP